MRRFTELPGNFGACADSVYQALYSKNTSLRFEAKEKDALYIPETIDIVGERSETLYCCQSRFEIYNWRAQRDSLLLSIEISDTYIFIYIVRQSLNAHASSLRNRTRDVKKTKSSVSVYVDSCLDS